MPLRVKRDLAAVCGGELIDRVIGCILIARAVGTGVPAGKDVAFSREQLTAQLIEITVSQIIRGCIFADGLPVLFGRTAVAVELEGIVVIIPVSVVRPRRSRLTFLELGSFAVFLIRIPSRKMITVSDRLGDFSILVIDGHTDGAFDLLDRRCAAVAFEIELGHRYPSAGELRLELREQFFGTFLIACIRRRRIRR